MDLNNEDDLKKKEDLHIAGTHAALEIFRFAVFFVDINWPKMSVLWPHSQTARCWQFLGQFSAP